MQVRGGQREANVGADIGEPESAFAWLVLDIAIINLYNRLNVTTRQVAGAQR